MPRPLTGYDRSMSRTKGKAKEEAGFVTRDRKVEAAGRVEQTVADPAGGIEEADVEEIRDETSEVRRKNGDLASDGTGGARPGEGLDSGP